MPIDYGRETYRHNFSSSMSFSVRSFSRATASTQDSLATFSITGPTKRSCNLKVLSENWGRPRVDRNLLVLVAPIPAFNAPEKRFYFNWLSGSYAKNNLPRAILVFTANKLFLLAGL